MVPKWSRFGTSHAPEPVDPAAVVHVAVETGLTAYDAGYLWLARELHSDLVTLDAALNAAAGY